MATELSKSDMDKQAMADAWAASPWGTPPPPPPAAVIQQANETRAVEKKIDSSVFQSNGLNPFAQLIKAGVAAVTAQPNTVQEQTPMVRVEPAPDKPWLVPVAIGAIVVLAVLMIKD